MCLLFYLKSVTLEIRLQVKALQGYKWEGSHGDQNPSALGATYSIRFALE